MNEYVEIFFKGDHLDMDIPEEGCIVLPSIEDVQGTRFDSMTCSTGVGKDTYSLDLIWSPSRAGEERIKWTSMNNQPINSKEHPLYGTKNEAPGLYHEELPAGCYICTSSAMV